MRSIHHKESKSISHCFSSKTKGPCANQYCILYLSTFLFYSFFFKGGTAHIKKEKSWHLIELCTKGSS